jgi:MFS family permease
VPSETRFGALREPAFRLLFLARVSSAAGDALIPVALAFAVLEVGGGASGLGLVFAAFTVSRMAFVLVGGVWADRLPRRAVLIACDAIRAAVDAFTAVALLAGFMELWMFLVTAALFGTASAFFGPASTGFVPATVSRERLQQANALLGMSESATSVFGPAISGLLVATAGPGWVFAVDSASFVSSGVFLLVLRARPQALAVPQRFLADLADGWREVSGRRWLWGSFIVFALNNMTTATLFVLAPVVAERDLGGADAFGLILTGGAVGGVVGGLAAYRFRPPRPLLAAYLVWMLPALPLLALAAPLPVVAIAVANGIFIFGIAFGNAVWATVIQAQVPEDRLSRVDAYDWMVSLLFSPLGAALAGPVSESVGIGTTLVACAIVSIGTHLIAFAAIPEIRAMRASSRAASAEDESPGPAPPGPLP